MVRWLEHMAHGLGEAAEQRGFLPREGYKRVSNCSPLPPRGGRGIQKTEPQSSQVGEAGDL